jgi:SET domain-containing protein
MQRVPSLFVAESDLGGRGIFTAAPIPDGSLIEICPVIVIPGDERRLIDKTTIYDYYFLWGEEEEDCAMALGYGSLYNHSFTPNAIYEADFEHKTMRFFALKDIAAGEEITVNYNGSPEDDEAVWFEIRE